MSQNTKVPPPFPVLPLPPLEYDIAFMNNLIRLLNFYIVQQANPGVTICSRLELNDGDADGSDVIIDTRQNNNDLTYFWMRELPTSATGLEVGQVWNDAGTLKIKI